MDFATRINKVRERLGRLSGFLFFRQPNIRYLTNFAGAGTLLITRKEAILFVGFLYYEEAYRTAVGVEVVKVKDVLKELPKSKIFKQLRKVGYDPQEISYATYLGMADNLRNKLYISQKMRGLREIKEPDEVVLIRNAQTIAETSLSKVKQMIRPGMTERDLRIQLEYEMLQLGSDKPAFDLIVLSGARSSLPHGLPEDRKLQPGDILLIDMGAVYRGYRSDMTRTFILGENKRALKLYEIVLRAQQSAIQAVKPGVELGKLDRIARQTIKVAGYDKYFGHSLGHGIGLEVHESPRVARRVRTKTQPGMVFTIEPGIYIPDVGGVRIEDMILVTATSYENLTKFPKSIDSAIIPV